MTKKKRVLYFMPDNPFWSQAGNLTRAKQLLHYFEQHESVLNVDFLSCLFWNSASIELFESKYPHIHLKLVDINSDKVNRLKYLTEDKIPRLIYKARHRTQISVLTPIIIKRFKSLLKERSYDVIIISYATWGGLIRELDVVNAHTIIDTHDFMTLQHMKEKSFFSVGTAFEEEIKILSLYDEIWTYSIEEQYIYSQFLNKNITLLPVSTLNQNVVYQQEKHIPILYVASDNTHNTQSMHWFVNHVLPLMPNYKIDIVGKICDRIDDHPQLIKHGMVEDINSFYASARITICPMLSGTGIKIKVLESLSHGLPVVTNRRGIDGLINKINNGCIVADDAAHFASSIERLLQDNVFYTKQCENAHIFYQSFYTFDNERKILDKIFIQ